MARKFYHKRRTLGLKTNGPSCFFREAAFFTAPFPIGFNQKSKGLLCCVYIQFDTLPGTPLLSVHPFTPNLP
jgi:hypothetical protein